MSGTMRNRSVNRMSAWSVALPEEARDRTERRAEDGRDERDRDADLERQLPRVQQPGELVATELVGAEPVVAVRLHRAEQQVLGVLAVRRDERRREAQRRSAR